MENNLEHIRPFSNGTEYDYWVDSNCYQCKRLDNCEIYEAIDIALIIGTIPQEIADSAGWDTYRRPPRKCKKFEKK